MNAEARCLINNDKAIIFLNIYSAVLIIISVLSLVFNNEINSLISIFLSIAIMAISVIIASMDFKEQASYYKSSYLELMKIEEELVDLETCLSEYSDNEVLKKYIEIKKKYIRILERTPNHKEIDYQKVMNSMHCKKHTMNLRNSIFNILYVIAIILPIILPIYFLTIRG